jgi:GNAT superfamily N-acetyltransferase
VKVQVEAFSRWMREAVELGLFEAHWNEVGEDRDTIALEPDFHKLLGMERAGLLASFTARDAAGMLAGYAMMLVAPHILYKAHVFACSVTLYIAPEHRGHGPELIRLVEREMRGRGVSKIFLAGKQSAQKGERSTLESLLPEMGYTLSETSFGKLLV